MDSNFIEIYNNIEIRQTDNDGFGVAGFGFFSSGHCPAWAGTFQTILGARAEIVRRLKSSKPATAKKSGFVIAVRATTCRRCDKSDLFDGAMFTTDSASGLCDDCYG